MKPRHTPAIGKAHLNFGPLRRLASAFHRRAITRRDKGEAALKDTLERIGLKQPARLVKHRSMSVKLRTDQMIKPRSKIAKLGADLGKATFRRAKPCPEIGQPQRRRRQPLLQPAFQPGDSKIDRLCASLNHL